MIPPLWLIQLGGGGGGGGGGVDLAVLQTAFLFKV